MRFMFGFHHHICPDLLHSCRPRFILIGRGHCDFKLGLGSVSTTVVRYLHYLYRVVSFLRSRNLLMARVVFLLCIFSIIGWVAEGI